ncbi:SCO7613 C-terminal domain-containing membrane protein [Nocardioides sp. SYSU DS0651]|uniref:SCO7613 C-terminal domain-containing membrane protein n=1 Tax=Nocardioides sp. SYSU DS0651 TaxID=3415955 RepID=UPI003F4C5C1C
MRYADPTLCPDCRSDLPRGDLRCPTCQLLVRHPLAVQLFGTLEAADGLLARLRSVSADVHTRPEPAAPAAPAAPLPASPLPALPPAPGRPLASRPAPARSGVPLASVPRILLGLGALCLLVAAVVFLAVSWSALGVGGRTVVLAALTVVTGAGAVLLQRAGLRIAAESLVAVALGLLALDVLGAGAAGWFGDASGGTMTLAAGLVVATAAAGLAAVRTRRSTPLLAPQVISGLGLLTAYVGAMDATDHRLLAGHALTSLGAVAVLAARSAGLPTLQWSQLAAGSVAWLGTALVALAGALGDPSLRQLWQEGSGWALLVTAGFLLLPGLVTGSHRMRVVGAGLAATVVTALATLPVIDTDATTVGLVALGATGAWLAALAALPRPLRAVAAAPATAGTAVLAALTLVTCAVAAARWIELGGLFAHPAGVVLRRPEPVTEPLLLVPSLLAMVALPALLADRRPAARTWLRVGVVVSGLGAATTLASYDVALAAPLAVLGLVALAAAAVALTSRHGGATAHGATALAVAGGACLVALPSSALTTVAAGVALVVALGLTLAGHGRTVRVLAGVATAPLAGLLLAAAVDVLGAGRGWVAVPVLLAVGMLAVVLPRPEVEVAAAATAVVTLPVSLVTAADPGGLAALWLTVAGCLVLATALVHDSRRGAAWAGGALLLLASWVRLADLDVRTPEAYTLPLGAVLVGLGLWRMHREPSAGTVETLLPGLLLSTLPTVVWVVGDPVSLRALLLGAACLVLAVAGATLRWSAPLVTGAAVGAVVVVCEIGPYASELPRWLWIGLAGALLTMVGITWERRLVEVRTAAGYLGRLR